MRACFHHAVSLPMCVNHYSMILPRVPCFGSTFHFKSVYEIKYFFSMYHTLTVEVDEGATQWEPRKDGV